MRPERVGQRVRRALISGLALAAALVVPARALTAQGTAPTVTAQLGSGVVRLGDQVVLTITVEGTRDARLGGLPPVEGLSFGEPTSSTSSYTQIVNGRRTSQVSVFWRVLVRPANEGEYTIPAIAVRHAGGELQTQPLPMKVVRDLRGEDLGFLEVVPSSRRVVEGQPFSFEVRFGWDREVDVNYAEFSLPWWDAIPGAIEMDEEEAIPSDASVVLVNDRHRVMVEELPGTTRDGREYRMLRLQRSFLPTRSGELEIPTSFLEFAKTRRVRKFFDTELQKVARYFVQADSFVLEVVPLPTEGQPFDFSGAVGSFTARASADTRDVLAGDSIKFTVEWTGSGNLEFFEPPDPSLIDAFRDFRVYGTTEEKAFDQRRVTYDLAPISPLVEAIPALPLSVFDAETETYRTVTTDPIPIRVRPLDNPVVLQLDGEERYERDIADIDARPLATHDPAPARAPGDRALALGLAGVPLLWLGLRTVVRRRRGDPHAPLERRRRRARRELARALRGPGDPRSELDAFLAFLAARTREPEEAWIGRDPARWVEEHGETPNKSATAEAARRAAELLNRLEREAFGGGGAGTSREEILIVADALVGGGL